MRVEINTSIRVNPLFMGVLDRIGISFIPPSASMADLAPLEKRVLAKPYINTYYPLDFRTRIND